MAQGETCTLERRTECKNCLSYGTLYEKLYSPRGYSENTAQFHVEKEKKMLHSSAFTILYLSAMTMKNYSRILPFVWFHVGVALDLSDSLKH